MVAAMGPVPCVPLIAFEPPQPPEAVQDVALVEFHVRVEAPPLATEVGLAVSAAVALPGTVTVIEATSLVPAGPTQVNEYMVVAATGPVLWLPLAGSFPLQPPMAAHEVVLDELQVSVDDAPAPTVVGVAENATLGGGTTLTVAVTGTLVPPLPLHISEYEVVVVRGPMLRVPLGSNAPYQPPDAVQDRAFAEFHVRIEVAPLPTIGCAALSDAVGAGPLAGVTATPPHAASIKDDAVAAKPITFFCKTR